MRPQELADRFRYLAELRSRFLDAFRAIGWEEVGRDRGATSGSMLGIFLHLLDDEEGWLQIATQGGSLSETPDRRTRDYVGFEQLAADHERVSALTRTRLGHLRPSDLEREVVFYWPEEARRSFETIATHAFFDELAHFGELVCLFWQLHVRPPFVDWIDFRTS